ncbi:14479_t:CDS:2, partial [Gigaspora rosea]
ANYNNGGPSFDSTPFCEEETRQAYDLETGSASQGSGSMLLSQDYQDALFSTSLDPNNYNYYDDDY